MHLGLGCHATSGFEPRRTCASRPAEVMSTEEAAARGDGADGFQGFVELHAGALRSSGVPELYWRSLHHKITKEVREPPRVHVRASTIHVVTRTREKCSNEATERGEVTLLLVS